MMIMNHTRYLSIAIGIAALGISSRAHADFDTGDFFDSGGSWDPVDVGYDSWGSYSYDGYTSQSFTDVTTPSAPSVASGWDYASTVPEGGYTIINGVMWPTCYGCTAGMSGPAATSMGVYDAYRQYNSLDLFFSGYGLVDSLYMGTYQGDTSFIVSNNFAFTHDFAVEQEGQWKINLTTPYCADLCVATFTNGTLTDAITGNTLTNSFGKLYDSTVTPAIPPAYSGVCCGDGDGDGDGDGG